MTPIEQAASLYNQSTLWFIDLAAKLDVDAEDLARAVVALGTGKSLSEYKDWIAAHPATPITPTINPPPPPPPTPAPTPLPPTSSYLVDPGAGDVKLSDFLPDQTASYLAHPGQWSVNSKGVAALNQVIAGVLDAVGANRTVYIDGLYLITQPVTVTKQCHWIRTNPARGFFAELNSGDALTFGSPDQSIAQVIEMQYHFGMWGGSCENGVQFFNLRNSNVLVTGHCGASKSVIVIGSCMATNFSLTCSLNYNEPNGTGGFGMGAWNGYAVTIEDVEQRYGPMKDVPVGNNGNTFDLTLEGNSLNDGLWIQGQRVSNNGDSVYRGTVQGFHNGTGILCTGAFYPHFENLHVEECAMAIRLQDTPNLQAVTGASFDAVKCFGMLTNNSVNEAIILPSSYIPSVNGPARRV